VPLKFYFILFAMSQFNWPITQKKERLWRLPKIEGSLLKYSVSPFWPRYIVERWTKFAKAYGIKVSAIGNSLGNMLGTEELFALTPHHCHP
jgi:hypothetical protein